MKEITTKVYEFNELSDKAKEKARDWFKEISSNDDHWKEYVIDDAKAIAKLMGIEIERIYFSGFWSQGDGACFVGKFRAGNVNISKLTEYAPKDKQLHDIAEEFERIGAKYPTLYFSTTHRDRYYHENSVDFDFELNDNEGNELPFDNEIEEQAKSVARRFMKWIYKKLEEAYEYENSNEVVDENIKANEYTFTEDGERFG